MVDGGSTDSTVEFARSFGARIVFQEGKGKGDALGKAIECLDSDYGFDYCSYY